MHGLTCPLRGGGVSRLYRAGPAAGAVAPVGDVGGDRGVYDDADDLDRPLRGGAFVFLREDPAPGPPS